MYHRHDARCASATAAASGAINLDAPVLLAEHGGLDYLTLEYLAELTMSILALQKQRDPSTGYAGDFLDVLGRLVPVLQRQPRLKIITNAGGMNPAGCAMQARQILDKGGEVDAAPRGRVGRRSDAEPRSTPRRRPSTHQSRYRGAAGVGAFQPRQRERVSRQCADCRGAATRRRHRHHRARRRRLSDGGAGRPRAALGVGRLGSPLRRDPSQDT